MNHFQKMCSVLFVLFVIPQMAQAVELGQVPPKVELQENLGGRLDGTAWRSDELKGNVTMRTRLFVKQRVADKIRS